jgi:hypothetical protein
MGQTAEEKWLDGATAALIERSGQKELVTRAVQKKVPGFDGLAVDGGEFRSMSLLDLARESLDRKGVRTRGLSKMDLAGSGLRRALHGWDVHEPGCWLRARE